jgi:cellulose synthase/poly-beta-1,6-N-acetylglucosamine synthase-like glycosyltransferase
MDKLLQLIFFFSAVLILHTYVFYPGIMILLFPKRKKQLKTYLRTDDLPFVNVLIAAYNEEKVIRQKLHSIFNSEYPISRLSVIVGSDASDDGTESIVENLQQKYPQLKLVRFKERTGKINIINHIQSMCEGEILIMTDANVIFTKNLIYELLKYFKNESVGIVAGNIIKVSTDNDGISFQEKKYLSLENKIKAAESNAFNNIMGAEGGCYAIRNELFNKVPSKFIVDDFFITFQVMNMGKYTLFNPDAICTEDVPGDIRGEFRRKVRISSGNFQNLFFFKKSIFSFWLAQGFAFVSHKVLRWFTPFFLISCFITSALLMRDHVFYLLAFLFQSTGFVITILNQFSNFKNSALKFISHFYMMNLALLEGFVKFTKGIKSSVWQPVKRNV